MAGFIEIHPLNKKILCHMISGHKERQIVRPPEDTMPASHIGGGIDRTTVNTLCLKK